MSESQTQAETTEQNSAENSDDQTSELRQDGHDLAENEFVSATISFKNAAGESFGIVRVKEIAAGFADGEASAVERADEEFRVTEATTSDLEEPATTKSAVKSIARRSSSYDLRFEEIDTIEKQLTPGQPKQEVSLYRMVVLGEFDTPPGVLVPEPDEEEEADDSEDDSEEDREEQADSEEEESSEDDSDDDE